MIKLVIVSETVFIIIILLSLSLSVFILLLLLLLDMYLFTNALISGLILWALTSSWNLGYYKKTKWKTENSWLTPCIFWMSDFGGVIFITFQHYHKCCLMLFMLVQLHVHRLSTCLFSSLVTENSLQHHTSNIYTCCQPHGYPISPWWLLSTGT